MAPKGLVRDGHLSCRSRNQQVPGTGMSGGASAPLPWCAQELTDGLEVAAVQSLAVMWSLGA